MGADLTLNLGVQQWRRSVINLGGQATSLPPSILLSSLPSRELSEGSAWAEPAHSLPNILLQFIQSNSLIKSILMFNVLPYTVHAEFSHALSEELILCIALLCHCQVTGNTV